MTSPEKDLLIKLEQSLWRPETRFDRQYMDTILASDFFEFGRLGRVYQRSDTLAAGRLPFTAILKNIEVRFITEAVAQITYVSEFKSAAEVELANRSSIWQKINGNWKLKFHQGTQLNPI